MRFLASLHPSLTDSRSSKKYVGPRDSLRKEKIEYADLMNVLCRLATARAVMGLLKKAKRSLRLRIPIVDGSYLLCLFFYYTLFRSRPCHWLVGYGTLELASLIS